MSYALDSSKRKFHRILESISNNAGTSSTATQTNNSSMSTPRGQPPSKRVRLTNLQYERAGLATALVRNGSLATLRSTTMSGSTLDLTGRTMAKTRLGDFVTPFAPTLRSDFLLRLKTFSVQALDKWDLKPDSLNEVQWAKRGWVLEEKETVRCICCSHRHILKYNEQEASIEEDDTLSYVEQELLREQAQEAIAAKWAELIIAGHSEKCPWRARGCDSTIYRLPVNHPAHAIPLLKDRYESVLTIHSKLPGALMPNDCPIDKLYKDFELCAYGKGENLNVEQDSSNRPPLEIRRLAFGFALLGWEVDPALPSPDAAMVTCKACFRRIGLWMWPTYEKRKGPDDECPLSDEHRWYCPWGNGKTQNEGAAAYNYYEEEDAPAWQQLARFIEKSGKSHLRVGDSAEVDANTEVATLNETDQTIEGSALGNPVSEAYPEAAGHQAEARDAEARAAEDRDRIGRWQRLKQKLALKPKKSGNVGSGSA